MDNVARRELEILTTLARGRPITQRVLARRLGVALGLANLYLRRLVRKGYVKVTTIPGNRIKYLVTPRGVAQKTRLTYEYLRYSLAFYRETRETLRRALAPLARNGRSRIALYGTGEVAELAYLTLRDLDIEPVAIVAEQASRPFLGHRVRALSDVELDGFDYVVVMSLQPADRIVARLTAAGVPRGRVVTLHRAPA